MIDEKIVSNVERILSFVNEWENKSILELCDEVGRKCNIAIVSDDKDMLIDLLIEETFSVEEVRNYRRYLEYVDIQRRRDFYGAIDSLYVTLKNNNTLFEERRKCLLDISSINSHKRKIETELRKFNLIRAKIEFSHVQNRHDNFNKVYITSGLESAKRKDTIDELLARNFIVKMFSNGKINSLKQEYEEYKIESDRDVSEAYDEYVNTATSYYDLLRKLTYDLLENKVVYDAICLSVGRFAGEEYETKGDIVKNVITVVDKDFIFAEFLKYAKFPEDDLSAEDFFDKFMEFVFYYYDGEIFKLNVLADKKLKQVREGLNGEQLLLDKINAGKGLLSTQVEMSVDERDSLGFVYRKN